APAWPINFLQNLARYVFKTGNVFQVNHYMNLNGPIALGEETDIRAAIFVQDPQLGAIDTPNGKVEFLQIVGVTVDELEAATAWNTAGLRSLLEADNPLLITDLARKSVLRDPKNQRIFEEGFRREGSSTGGQFVEVVRWQEHKGKPKRLR